VWRTSAVPFVFGMAKIGDFCFYPTNDNKMFQENYGSLNFTPHSIDIIDTIAVIYTIWVVIASVIGVILLDFIDN